VEKELKLKEQDGVTFLQLPLFRRTKHAFSTKTRKGGKRLSAALGIPKGRLLTLRQVHGAEVRFHGPGAPGLHLADPCDGHVTDAVCALLTVATADCVPVFAVAPDARAVAIVHAGWRGVAAGILERGLEEMVAAGGRAEDTVMHCGVSICGNCYEVGPEVISAVTGRRVPGPTRLDLRNELAARATRACSIARL